MNEMRLALPEDLNRPGRADSARAVATPRIVHWQQAHIQTLAFGESATGRRAYNSINFVSPALFRREMITDSAVRVADVAKSLRRRRPFPPLLPDPSMVLPDGLYYNIYTATGSEDGGPDTIIPVTFRRFSFNRFYVQGQPQHVVAETGVTDLFDPIAIVDINPLTPGIFDFTPGYMRRIPLNGADPVRTDVARELEVLNRALIDTGVALDLRSFTRESQLASGLQVIIPPSRTEPEVVLNIDYPRPAVEVLAALRPGIDRRTAYVVNPNLDFPVAEINHGSHSSGNIAARLKNLLLAGS